VNCAVAVDKEGVGPIFFLARKHFPEERRLAASRVIITLLFHGMCDSFAMFSIRDIFSEIVLQ
jgi:hypothetical protein